MTFDTRDRHVLSRKLEARVLVLGQSERRWAEALDRVATLAAVPIRRRLELAEMRVAMAIGALCELDLVERRLARRHVTLRTRHVGMLSDQRISGIGVLLKSKGCGLETLDGVARRALAGIGTPGELPAVRIRPVAIGALLEDERLLEVSTRMAGDATHVRMFAEERELGGRVVELPRECRRRDGLPRHGVVTGLTTGCESAAVRISVACIAPIECQAGPSRLAVGAGRVTLFAFHLRVSAGEGELRLAVVELRDHAPIRRAVTLMAGGPETPLMLVLVTTHTGCRQPEESPIQVFDLNGRLIGN